MRKGRELVMATMPFAREVTWRSWSAVISTVLVLLCCFTFATLPLLHWGFRLAIGFLTGFVLVRMFVMFHDHMHGSLLSKSPIGKVIMKAFGIFILTPASIWKRSHDYHHKHNSKLFTASIGSYPIMTKQKFEEADRKTKKAYLRSRSTFTILAGYYSMFLHGMVYRSLRNNPNKHWDSAIAFIVHVGLYVGLYFAGGWMAMLFAGLIPYLVSTALGAYLFYVQHNFPGVTFATKENWDYFDAALQSSSYMRMGPFMRWSTANIGYHHIHHLNERIPFYRLPEVYKAIPELQNPKVTTWHPRDVIASLRLKLWDPKRER